MDKRHERHRCNGFSLDWRLLCGSFCKGSARPTVRRSIAVIQVGLVTFKANRIRSSCVDGSASPWGLFIVSVLGTGLWTIEASRLVSYNIAAEAARSALDVLHKMSEQVPDPNLRPCSKVSS